MRTGDATPLSRAYVLLTSLSRCFWYLWQTNRVLNNFSNFVGSLVTIFASFFALNATNMNAGEVGFSITYACKLRTPAKWRMLSCRLNVTSIVHRVCPLGGPAIRCKSDVYEQR